MKDIAYGNATGCALDNALVLDRALPRIGLSPATEVLTLDGSLPMDWIEAGDRIITRDRGMCLVTTVTHWDHSGPVVLIRKNALGPDLPSADLRLVPNQKLRLRPHDPILPGLLLEAYDLVDSFEITLEFPPNPIRLFDLGFDDPHIVYANGVEVLVGPLDD